MSSPLARPAAGPITDADFESLPRPVERYLRAVLGDVGEPIRSARIAQKGEFLMRPDTPNGWRPFEAIERFTVDPPGFTWDARIRLAPGLCVRVVDSLVGGRAAMRATALGLLPVARARHSPELAAGQLQRYLAEAVLFPTALLPRSGVSWQALAADTARATLAVGSAVVSLDFSFGLDGLVTSVFAPARFREVDGHYVPTPWRGHWSDYASASGLRVPRRGAVEWQIGGRPLCYWRGRMEDVSYEHGRTAAA